jgi:hypothetical protein
VTSSSLVSTVTQAPGGTNFSLPVTITVIESGLPILDAGNLFFFYVPACPASCGNGSCSLGACVCAYLYVGTFCDQRLVEVTIGLLPPLQMNESAAFTGSPFQVCLEFTWYEMSFF